MKRKMKMKTSNPDRKPPEQLQLTAQMEITAAADAGDGAAKLPRFSMIAYTGGPMRIAGWRYPVVLDLAGLAIPRQNAPVREAHGARVGHAESIRVEDGKLLATGVISCTGQVAREVVDAAYGSVVTTVGVQPPSVTATVGVQPPSVTAEIEIPT